MVNFVVTLLLKILTYKSYAPVFKSLVPRTCLIQMSFGKSLAQKSKTTKPFICRMLKSITPNESGQFI